MFFAPGQPCMSLKDRTINASPPLTGFSEVWSADLDEWCLLTVQMETNAYKYIDPLGKEVQRWKGITSWQVLRFPVVTLRLFPEWPKVVEMFKSIKALQIKLIFQCDDFVLRQVRAQPFRDLLSDSETLLHALEVKLLVHRSGISFYAYKRSKILG